MTETLSSTWTPEFTEPNETVCDLKQNHFGSRGFTENPRGKSTPQRKWAKTPPQLLLWPCLILFFKLFCACGEYEMDASGKLPLGQGVYVFIEWTCSPQVLMIAWCQVLHTGSDQAGTKCRTCLIFPLLLVGATVLANTGAAPYRWAKPDQSKAASCNGSLQVNQ